MKQLLIESTLDTRTLSEDAGSGKNWFIEGVYLQPDVVVKNRRIYPGKVLKEAVNSYSNNFVKTNRAVGELSHPDSLSINLDKIALKIESLEFDGTNYTGKSRVLNTPCGRILQSLLEGGVRIGVSTRGAGSTTTGKNGIPVVNEDFGLVAIDAVYNPSAPDAFVQGLMEGSPLIWDTNEKDVAFLESIRDDIKGTNRKHLTEAKIEAFSNFMKHLRSSK